MVVVKLVESDDELAGILSLQARNLKRNLTKEEIEHEGFVTAEYNMEIMKRMHEVRASVIAKDGNEVVGYLIATTKAIKPHHGLLSEFFDQLDQIEYNGKSLKEVDYMLGGQVCVAKGYRGKGLFVEMHNFYRDAMKADFPYCITDIDFANVGSLRAHEKVGFKELKVVHYWGVTWKIVIWDWN